jgi:antitoxin component YwqK of YwqJK toxin-antitoxin module
MKRYILLFLFLSGFLTQAQYYSEEGYYFINKLDFSELSKFYFNEYEFNPAEIAPTLAEIQTLKKSNQNPSVEYEIYKVDDQTTKVIVRANNKIFSESYYQNGLLNGKKTVYHGSGNPFHEIDYVNGKANGVYKMYSDFSELVFETQFKNNQKNGKRTFYLPRRRDGRLEGIYKNNVLTGDLTLIKEYSTFILPKNLKSGKVKEFSNNFLVAEYDIIGNAYLHGLAIVYNVANGKPYSKVSYKYNRKDGVAEFYSQNGELMTKNEYKNDAEVGEHKFYTKDFKLTSIKNYDSFGIKSGTWTTFYSDGKKWMVTEYENDKPKFKTNYDSKGEMTAITQFNNEDDSEISKSYKNGIVVLEVVSQKYNRKEVKSYYNDGTLFSVETKKEQYYNREIYNKDGTIFHVNKVTDDGKRLGIHKNVTLTDDKIIINDETHYDDKGNKIKHIYKTSGDETYETNYRNNALHGEKVNRDYNGNVIKSEFFYESNGKTKPVTKEEFDNLTKNEKK